MWTGFGVRTLADDMGAHNPVSYHNGSVWPHDSAIAAAGLARYGYRVEAQWIDVGLLDAAHNTGQRLPELFCGFDRAEFDPPVPYPTSCAPQAWAAAAPLLLVRSLLGLNPDVPAGVVRMAPAVPEHTLPLRVERIRLAGARVDVEVRAERRRAAERGAARRSPIRPADPPGHELRPRFHPPARCVRVGSEGRL